MRGVAPVDTAFVAAVSDQDREELTSRLRWVSMRGKGERNALSCEHAIDRGPQDS
jgi:hypothetical protein